MAQMRSCDAVVVLQSIQPTIEDEEEVRILDVRLLALESDDAVSCPRCLDVKVLSNEE